MHLRFGNDKSWKSMISARWLSELSMLILCCTPSLTEGRSVKNPRNVSYSTIANHQDECSTPECIHTASMILRNMDSNVDPCDDFYRYACGGYINKTVLPDGVSEIEPTLLMYAKLHEQIKAMIETTVQPNEPRHFRLVKDLYKICVNTTAIEAAGLGALHDQLKKLGGWPVLVGDAWKENEFNWQSTIYKFRKFGYPYDVLIGFGIVLDWENGTKRMIEIDEGTTRLPRTYLLEGLKNEIVVSYYKYMVDVAVLLGANRRRARIELIESLLFEMQLADISSRNYHKQLYNPMTLKALSNIHPRIPWKEYITNLLPSSITVKEDEVFIVRISSYITKLEKLLSETPKRIQANYLIWIAVTESITYLNDAIRNRKQQFPDLTVKNTKLPKNMARSTECTKTVFEFFPIITSAMYVRKYFNAETKKSAAELIMDIREQFKIVLKKVDWMDVKTREKALEKATAMVSHVAYPEELLDDEVLEKLYEKLDLFENNYLGTALNLKLFHTDSLWKKFREPVNKSNWMNHGVSAVINAFYTTDENSIEFPAGVLQGVFFHKDRPKYINYGSTGFIVGHEITHAFDNEGKRFDKNGNMVNWWVSSTERNYNRRVECIMNQYGNYHVPEVNLNLDAYNTRDENVADVGGIKIAYLAYKSWVKRNKPENKLPGINRSPEQMFWIGAANVWCSKITREALLEGIISEPHSPNEFRVRGSFSNMPEFAKDFNCPEGSAMNPKKKCSIW
ncbi:VLP3p-4, transcript variant X7 [Venturia canescens]|uniref:VLP3p-4, transcript variant X7 n=1 Tax=Venturia canescens TaxID=32260 RepID=A0ACB9ZI23_9HYME|nr:neprilysin-2-like isoform X2 [Venturia canescens]KAI5630575.1 VLP3p-4, transcript variant X7 [Venturia canescens]